MSYKLQLVNDLRVDFVEIEYLAPIDSMLFANSYQNRVAVVVMEERAMMKMSDRKID